MASAESYELKLWEGDYGLPSLDIDSLIVYAYIKSLKKDCNMKYCSNPLLHTLPGLYVQMNNKKRTIDISNFTEKWYYGQLMELPDLDSELTPLQQTESRIYYCYLKECFLPCIWDALWVREETYAEETRRWYNGGLPFPLGLFYPWWRRKHVVQYVRSLASEDDSEELHSRSLLDKAKGYLDNLSAKLNEKQFILGTTRPSTIDIINYAHIALVLEAPVGELRAHALSLTNLVDYSRRMSRLWPGVAGDITRGRSRRTAPTTDPDISSSPGTLIAALLVASTAMISYGMFTGVIARST